MSKFLPLLSLLVLVLSIAAGVILVQSPQELHVKAQENLTGDVNLDGVIDERDVNLCADVYLGNETDPDIVARCDVNGDGEVNVLDVQLIVNMCTVPSCVEFKPTPTPSPPPGCYYEQVQCIQAPCPPILVCPTPTTQPISGDINGDGVVNILDFQILSNKFGTNDVASDLNGDGGVNILDFQVLSNNFGKTG